MFAKNRDWLEKQPRMTPWNEGCENLAAWLIGWLVIYSKRVRGAIVDPTDEASMAYLERMWSCLSHHWKQAAELADDGAIDGTEVATSIRAGCGYQRGRKLGGDPLRDVVMAVAMQNKDNEAAKCFQEEYKRLACFVAGKVNSNLLSQSQVDEWWTDLFIHLVGSEKSGGLASYSGQGALSAWLPRVVWRFLCRWRPAMPGQQETFDHWIGDSGLVITDDRLKECYQAFVPLVAVALGRLTKRKRLILRLYYVEGWTQKKIGGLIGIHHGNVGIQRREAIDEFIEFLREEAEKQDDPVSYLEHLGYLQDQYMEVPKDFANALRDGLTCWGEADGEVEDEEEQEDEEDEE